MAKGVLLSEEAVKRISVVVQEFERKAKRRGVAQWDRRLGAVGGGGGGLEPFYQGTVIVAVTDGVTGADFPFSANPR